MLYKSEVSHNAAEATQKICCAKDEGAVDHCTVTRWSEKFCSDYKNLDNYSKLGLKPKILRLCSK